LLTTEKISPLTFKTISVFKPLISRLALSEKRFFELCSILYDQISLAYHNVREVHYNQPIHSKEYIIKVSADIDSFIRAFEFDQLERHTIDNYTNEIYKLVGSKSIKQQQE
jgi:hypothetical protein